MSGRQHTTTVKIDLGILFAFLLIAGFCAYEGYEEHLKKASERRMQEVCIRERGEWLPATDELPVRCRFPPR